MTRASGKPKPTRAARSFGAKIVLFLKIAAGTTLALGVAGGVVLHMELAVTRRLVARIANKALLPVFRGRLTIETLGRLGLDGFDGARVRIDDPTGQPVLTADGVSGRISALKLARVILGSAGTIELDITEATVEHADLRFDTDERGMPMLEHALTPVVVSQTPEPGAKPSRPIRVVISSARVRHAWVHGHPTWAPPVDLEGRDIEARVVVTSEGSVEVDVHQGQLVARALPVAGTGGGSMRGRVLVPSERGNAVGITAFFDGSLGGIEESASLSLDGADLAGTLDLKEVAPEKVRSLAPDYPVQDLLSAHIDTHGTVPELDVTARAALRGGGILATSGKVLLSEKGHASFHATLAAIDLRGLAPGMPVSSLGAAIDATLTSEQRANVTGTARVVSEGGTVGTQVLPAATVDATFSSGARGPRLDGRVDANVAFRDPGLTGTAALHLHPKGKSFELAFDAKADAPRLNGVPRFKLTTQGSVAASTHGTLDFNNFAMTADVEARGQGLAQGASAHVGSATASGHVTGTVFAPRIDASVHAISLDVSSVHADRADLTIGGLARAPHVHATLGGGDVPDIVADADVQLGATTLLRDVRASLSRATDAAELRADAVRITSEGMTAEQVTIDGLGGPVHADIKVAPHTLQVRAAGREIEVGRVARLTGMEAWCTGGKLAFDVDATVHGANAEGHATIDVTGASVVRVRGANAHVELTLKDRHVEGRARAELGDFGSVDIVGEKLTMGKEGASSLRSWQRLSGALAFNAKVDMARLEQMLPEGSLPFRVTRGQLEVEAQLKRDSPSDDTPHLALTARTAQLAVEAKTDEAPPGAASPGGARPAARWRIDGVDLGVDARIDGESGYAELALRVVDAKGTLVSVDAKSTAMPYTALLLTPSRARDLLAGVAFDASVVVPRRDLSTLPPTLGLGGTDGELSAEVAMHGTLATPEVDLKASLSQAHVSLARVSFPVDFDLTSHYAAGHTDARLLASTTRRAQVMDAEAHVEGRLLDVFERRAQASWAASGRAHLDAFPLGGVGFLEDRQVRGHLTGDVVLEGLHRDAHASLDLASDDLQIGDVDYKGARIHAALDGHAVDATVHLDHGDGSADAHAVAGAAWGAAIVPSIDPPVDLSVSATAFRAETLLPFLHETVAELEGKIDGKAHMAYDPRANKTELDGKIVYSHGKFQMSSALGEFHDVTATLVLTPDGVVRLIDTSASGVTGRVQAAASARLASGKQGLVLGAARARIDIPKGSPIPVTIEGTPLGSIQGSIEVSENPTADLSGMIVAVDIPTLHVTLPPSGSRNLQPLGELDHAEVGVHRGPSERELVLVPLGPPREEKTRAATARRIEITTHIGNDVEVKRGVDLKVGLEGQPSVTITDKVHVTGQIRLKKNGILDVQGKAFEIESGTITFVGDDPENPQVVVTAGWTAPDGTRILADYIGPLKTGKVVLRSEPPLPQPDIVALLLFGNTEGQSGAPGQSAANSATTTAVSAAGGVAAQPINHALDQFGVHAVAARVDTSQAASPKPEVELQIAKNISVQLAVVIGTPPPGVNPDTTLLTLNWRLLRSLTVATTVGNLGSSFVDMVWERRY